MNFKFLNGLLDPDERISYINRKIEACKENYRNVPFKDPAIGILNQLGKHFNLIKNDVELWLTPTPPPEMIFMVTVENIVTFIDSNGCKDYADQLMENVYKNVIPEVPILIGVDHSLSGGAIRALCKEYGHENIRLIVFDSHTDFILPTIRCGLIHYDLENNPDTKFSPYDPYIYNRPDSYNADSFLSYISKELPPENIFLIGVSDHPSKAAEEINDERVKKYVEFYKDIEDSKVHIIKKDDIKKHFDNVCRIISNTSLPYTYISIDVDVCANVSIKGARFLDYLGISHNELYSLISCINKSKSKIIGMDIMEFDVYNAGSNVLGKIDRTYEIMAEVLRRTILDNKRIFLR